MSTLQEKTKTQSTQEKIKADKNALYGDFTEDYKKSVEWRRELGKKAAHKALDIPMGDDDVNISPQTTNNVTNNSGLSGKSVLGAVALMSLGMLGAGSIGYLLNNPTPVSITTPNRDTDTNTKYFFDVDKENEINSNTDE